MGDGNDGALPPAASGQTVKSDAEIRVPFADGRPTGFDERFAQHLVALAELAASALAGALVVAGAETGPGGEMMSAGEVAEIGQSRSDGLRVAELDAGGGLQAGERISERAQAEIQFLF